MASFKVNSQRIPQTYKVKMWHVKWELCLHTQTFWPAGSVHVLVPLKQYFLEHIVLCSFWVCCFNGFYNVYSSLHVCLFRRINLAVHRDIGVRAGRQAGATAVQPPPGVGQSHYILFLWYGTLAVLHWVVYVFFCLYYSVSMCSVFLLYLSLLFCLSLILACSWNKTIDWLIDKVYGWAQMTRNCA